MDKELSFKNRLLTKHPNGLRRVESFKDLEWLHEALKKGEAIKLTPECYEEVVKLYEPLGEHI